MSDYATKDEVQEIVNKAVVDLSEIISNLAQTMHGELSEIRKDIAVIKNDVNSILNRLDSIEKDISLNDDERAVMGMQLTRLHDWVEKAAKKVGVEFIH